MSMSNVHSHVHAHKNNIKKHYEGRATVIITVAIVISSLTTLAYNHNNIRIWSNHGNNMFWWYLGIAGVTAGVGQQRSPGVPSGGRSPPCAGRHTGRPPAHCSQISQAEWAGGCVALLCDPAAAAAHGLGYPLRPGLPSRCVCP